MPDFKIFLINPLMFSGLGSHPIFRTPVSLKAKYRIFHSVFYRGPGVAVW